MAAADTFQVNCRGTRTASGAFSMSSRGDQSQGTIPPSISEAETETESDSNVSYGVSIDRLLQLWSQLVSSPISYVFIIIHFDCDTFTKHVHCAAKQFAAAGICLNSDNGIVQLPVCYSMLVVHTIVRHDVGQIYF